MSKVSKVFLSLIIMCGFVLAQNTGANQTSDPGAAGQPSANQTEPSANGNTASQANGQTKKKHKKKKDNMNSADPSGNMNNGSTSTSQGTGQQPQDQGTAPNTPNDQTPQSNPGTQTPPQSNPPKQ
jgi:hypothetical protein